MRKYLIATTLVLALIVGLVLFRAASPTMTSNKSAAAAFSAIRTASVPTPTPTLAPVAVWRSLTTFTGSGSQHTASFTVPLQWRLSWQCQGHSDGTQGQLGALPHDAHGSIIKDFASGTCRAGGVTDGHLDEIGAGTFWLEIIADGNGWTVTVQVPK